MKKLNTLFFSLPMTFVLLFVYALACGVATFIENDFGIVSANALIYQAFWFDLLHFFLFIHLIGMMIKGRMYQKNKPSFILHLSLLVILLGAGVTRYFGVEGGIHIREGESSNLVLTREEFINLSIYANDCKTQYSFGIVLTPLIQSSFEEAISLGEETLKLKLLSYDSKPSAKLTLELSTPTQSRTIILQPNATIPQSVEFNNAFVELSYGAREIELPFALHLEDFILETYAGSNNPSSYASKIIVEDLENEKSFPYTIFMNNVLDYGGYRFFQSSYDEDLEGTILSVNRDPGKWITYCGYALLVLGFLAVFFSKHSYFARLCAYLRVNQVYSLLFVMLCCTPLYSQNTTLEFFENLKTRSLEDSSQFGELIVQDFDGRFEPMDTLALDFIHKLAKSDSVLGLNANQLFLGMMIFPNELRQLKMIALSNPKLKEILSIPASQKKIAYNDVFANGVYILENYAQEALRKDSSKRDELDKAVLKLDEKINIASYIYSGFALRVIPNLTSSNQAWLSPAEVLPFDRNLNKRIQVIIGDLFFGFYAGVQEGKWEAYNQALTLLKELQSQSPSLPSLKKVKFEIWLNTHNPFKLLIGVYLILALGFLALGIASLLSYKPIYKRLMQGLYVGLLFAGIYHTLSLGVRWYVSDHAPWSNAYESMIYIAFSCVLAGVVFFRRSTLALCASSAIAGISLFVANLGFMDPQITHLAPVLKSYWLNIHVSIITASYGFLGLCFMIGVLSLVLFILRRFKNLDLPLCNLHCINELSMLLGLAMLTIGNFLGGVWANESWGRYWGWDPKETWSLISIIVYTMIIHLRLIKKWYSPYSFALSSVIGFFCILMTYFGVNYYLSGRHSYASGDPLEIPMFVYVMLLGIVGLVVLSWKQRRLDPPKL